MSGQASGLAHSKPPMSPTVFIVDDDLMARDSVIVLVQSMNLPVQGFASGEEFLQSGSPNAPGCLITDVQMKGMDGYELQQRLREGGSLLPIIVLTAYAQVQTAVDAMRKGAVTVLEKPCRPEVLEAAVRQALATNAELRRQHERSSQVQERLSLLTPKETEVLQRIMAGKLNKVIARELDVSERTVETRRQKIFRKMGAASLAELIGMVMEVQSDAEPD